MEPLMKAVKSKIASLQASTKPAIPNKERKFPEVKNEYFKVLKHKKVK